MTLQLERGPGADAAPAVPEVKGSSAGRGIPGWLGAAPLLVFLAVFLVIPIAANILTSFIVDGRFSLSAMALLLEPQLQTVLIVTLLTILPI